MQCMEKGGEFYEKICCIAIVFTDFVWMFL